MSEKELIKELKSLQKRVESLEKKSKIRAYIEKQTLKQDDEQNALTVRHKHSCLDRRT